MRKEFGNHENHYVAIATIATYSNQYINIFSYWLLGSRYQYNEQYLFTAEK